MQMGRLMPQSSVDPVVAQNLRETLKASGRSAYAVAMSLGHAPNWLYRVINGESGILIPTLREVAEELGVPAGSLLDGPAEIKETTDDAVWLVEVKAKPESRTAGYDETFSRRLPNFPRTVTGSQHQSALLPSGPNRRQSAPAGFPGWYYCLCGPLKTGARRREDIHTGSGRGVVDEESWIPW